MVAYEGSTVMVNDKKMYISSVGGDSLIKVIEMIL